MTETLSFPKLGWEINLKPVIVQITDTWGIHWYGVIFAVAFVVGVGYALRQAKAFGLDPDRVLDVCIGAVLGGIVGARLYFVFFFDWATYRSEPIRILQIWTGGIAMYGGIIGGIAVGIFMCRWRKVKLLPMMDIALLSVMMGQAIGRWGNFVNMEAFGGNTDLPWGMTSPTIVRYLEQKQLELAQYGVAVDPYAPVHPTFLYESLWCVIGIAFLIWYSKRRRFDGEMALIYAGWYGLGRFWIEGLRTDSLMWGNVRVSQAVALLCVIAAAVTLAVVHSKIRRANDPDYLRLYVETDEGKAVVAGTFYTEGVGAGTAASKALAAPSGAVTAVGPRSRIVRQRGRAKMAAVRLASKAHDRNRGLRR